MSHALMFVITALGWVGALVGLVAYAMVSQGRWSPNSLQFQLANLCATSLMFLVAAVNGVWPSVAANIAWMVIGAQALLVIAKARRNARPRLRPVHLPLVESPLPGMTAPVVGHREVRPAAAHADLRVVAGLR